MVGEVQGNILGMLADLMLKLQNGVITPGQLGKFLKKEDPFIIGDYLEIIAEWEKFYKKYFDLGCDFSSVHVPEKPAGKYRLLIVGDISLEKLYVKCKELFPCWRWTNDDLDKIVVWNERDAKESVYAIWVKDVVEADEDLKNLSADDIKGRGLMTETLAERFIHGLMFFDETSKHLDIKNLTLCTGSRCADGDVPDVSWCGDGEMHVHRYHPDRRNVHLRARSAV